jgi:hypothetical protein
MALSKVINFRCTTILARSQNEVLNVSIAKQDHSRSFYTHTAYPFNIENTVRLHKLHAKWIQMIFSHPLIHDLGVIHNRMCTVLNAINLLFIKVLICMYCMYIVIP